MEKADFITELFAMHGSAQTAGGNAPLPLVDPGAVWLVTEGHVDIVALTISREGGAADLQRTHLLRISAGQFLFGFHAHPEGHNVLIMGYGSADAEMTRLPVARLARAAADPPTAHEIAAAVDRWITAICELCAGDLTPSGALNVRAGAQCTLEARQSAQPQSGVLWLKPVEGAARFLNHDGPCTIKGDILFPVGKDAWLTADDSQCTFVSHDSGALELLDDSYWRGLDAFHDTVEAVIDIQRQRDREMTRQRLVAKSEADRSTLEAAFGDLESILNRKRAARVGVGAETGLLSACRLVGEHAGIDVREPGRASRSAEHANPLEEIARTSRFALRRVELRGSWYRQDNGPLLGFRADGDAPVALVPTGPTSYELQDVTEGTVEPVTPGVAATVQTSAFMFYRTLPDRALRGLDLARFALRALGRDLFTVAMMGAAAGLLMLATPIAIGHVFDVIIPGVERLQLAQITMGLAVAAFAIGAFQVTRNVALIRLKHRAGDGLQAAVWERLINLPSKFFGDYSAGDLGVRAMGIDSIMEQLSTSAITTIVSSIFSLFAIALLFYYSPLVAVIAVGMVLLVVAAVIASGLAQVPYKRAIEESHGKIAGMLLQFMNGISKIRIAAAEDRAFAQWADRFAHQTRLVVSSRIISNNLAVLMAAVPLLSSIVIFLFVARPDGGSQTVMTTGAFLGFIAAYATLLSGMIQLGTTVVGLLNVVPIYARLKPILESEPEVDASKTDSGPLRGRIEVSNVSFRYTDDAPLVLEDVSFDAHPGEFVALVGPSGSGKSTLLRMLLGFEQPESGSVAYDGFDLAGIDLWRLRRQLGVVLQNGDLLPGDIFTNIVGSAVDLTLNDAWEAARLAGLDKDVEQMPMGMHTVITEGASTLSGGQRQRLMIARALVTKPRVVFFDEATSALDNPTQAVVTESLDRLRATRIVIAHRLSTIIKADRIFVLDHGRIVQAGTYEELVSRPGLFHELVKRQIA